MHCLLFVCCRNDTHSDAHAMIMRKLAALVLGAERLYVPAFIADALLCKAHLQCDQNIVQHCLFFLHSQHCKYIVC